MAVFLDGRGRLLASTAFAFLLLGSPSPIAQGLSDLEKAVEADAKAATETQKQLIQEQQALAKLGHGRLVGTGSAIERQLDELVDLIESWRSQSTALLESEDGRLIASNREDVALVDGLITRLGSGAPDLSTWRTELELLTGPSKVALQNAATTTPPSPEIEQAVNALQETVSGVHNDYSTALSGLTSLLAGARARGVAGSSTLKEAREQLRLEETRLALAEASESARAAREVVEAARQEQELELAAAKARLIEEETAAELARLEQKSAVRQSLAAEKEEKARLEAQASDPAIRRKFGPFLGKGLTAFVALSPTNGQWRRRHDTPLPPSLTELQDGYIMGSVTMFGHAASHPSNDRGTWERVRDYGIYQDEFELFQKLAPIWVEQGVLRQ